MTDNLARVEQPTMGAGALAVATPVTTFNLPALSNPQEALEVIQDNLADLGGQLKFDEVKIPSGGGISFEIIDENGEGQPSKTLTGVVLDFYPIKAWWASEYSGDKNPPDCASMDATIGTGSANYNIPAGQNCANCPNNQWGSDPKGGKGKACKDIIRVYMLQEETVFPVLLALPPTSTGNWKDYVRRLTSKMKPYYGVVTQVKLEKDKNDGGIEYSKAVFSKVADLNPEEKVAMKKYAINLKDSMRSVAIDSTEYDTGATNVSDDPY